MSIGKKILSIILSVTLVAGVAALSAVAVRSEPPGVQAAADPPWWQDLPNWVQWILRYLLFGWAWMGPVKTVTTGPGILVTRIAIAGGASVKVGGSLQLTATVTPADATNKSIDWSVNNTDLATISASGVLTGKQAGYVVVTAAARDGSKVKDARTIQVTS